jgi:hypothetical protein
MVRAGAAATEVLIRRRDLARACTLRGCAQLQGRVMDFEISVEALAGYGDETVLNACIGANR